MYLSCGVLRHILYMQREKPVSLLLDVKHICSPSYGVRLVVPYLVLAWWQRQLCCAINNHLSILPASGMGGCLWDVVHAWFDCIETQRPCNHKCSWENILSLYSLLNCYSPLTEWVILLQSAIKSIIYYIPLFRASELWSRTHAHTHTCTHTHAHTHTHTHTTSLPTRAASWRLQPLRGVPHQMLAPQSSRIWAMSKAEEAVAGPLASRALNRV